MTDETQINQINIYEQSEAAGKCLVLSPESSFNIDFEYTDANNILIEFWTAIGEGVDIFAELIDEITQQKITSIDLNNFGYLTIPSILDAEFFNDTYVAPNVWNYILVKIDRQRGTANIYVNNQLFYVGPINTFSNQTSAQLVFKNLSSEGKLKIDRLKIWSFENNVSLALSNMNYNDYRADSSQIIYSNNFDSERILKDIQTSGRVKLIESTAPIFSKAPVLRASVINQSIQLGLEVSDFTQVESYIIEKSYDGIDFSPVVTIRNIEEGKSRYTTTDYDASQNQIIYYRVKQVNIDGTETFSSVVKVGRGRQTHFKINQNYPNPFNPRTMISLDVKRNAEFNIKVYDLVGTVVTVLHTGQLNEGTHRFEFDGADLPSGLYFCEVQSDNDLEVMKMILAK
ncbi:MAG: T9SS type A sorting domain-containing protein [Melioribacteraceae bacterium]|nr:T9SS type A sorting domain-containing protein [Melioribacteraceae bacterium]